MILQKYSNVFFFLSDVIRANYGRFSITICNQHGNTDWKVDCQAGRTLRAMQARCSNKNQCIVPVQSSIFGDPCPGTYKYIEVYYVCRKGTLSLSWMIRVHKSVFAYTNDLLLYLWKWVRLDWLIEGDVSILQSVMLTGAAIWSSDSLHFLFTNLWLTYRNMVL